MMHIRQLLLLSFAAIVAACAHAANSASAEPDVGARIAGPLRQGDCVEARRRAALQPNLEVEQLPAPVAMKPAPFRNVPDNVFRKDGSAEIKIDMIIDTLVRADMSTFKVVKVTNNWFAENVLGVVPKWTCTPAILAGCR